MSTAASDIDEISYIVSRACDHLADIGCDSAEIAAALISHGLGEINRLHRRRRVAGEYLRASPHAISERDAEVQDAIDQFPSAPRNRAPKYTPISFDVTWTARAKRPSRAP